MAVLDRMQSTFTIAGYQCQREAEHLAFMCSCGLFATRIRLFQKHSLLVLIGELGFYTPADRRTAVAEFCNAANYTLLPFANLEMDPNDGQVQLRHSLLLPAEGAVSDSQLKWLVASAAKIISNLSQGLVDVAFGSADPVMVVKAAVDTLYPEGKPA